MVAIPVISAAEGQGIMVDLANPTWGWRDIEGLIYPDTSAPATAPVIGTFIPGGIGGVKAYAYESNDLAYFSFHIPHDYAPGTDLYIHSHWGHNSATIGAPGIITFDYDITYAKGHHQQAFGTPVLVSTNELVINIASHPQYYHEITEGQLSTPGGSVGALLDTNEIEPDGVIAGTVRVNFPAGIFNATTPTGTAGAGVVYLFTMDLHYQSTNIGTKNRTPDFYG